MKSLLFRYLEYFINKTFTCICLAAKDCTAVGQVSNCHVWSNGTKPGSVAVYTCNPGYALTSGDKYRFCGRDGEWSGGNAVCGGRYITNELELFYVTLSKIYDDM